MPPEARREQLLDAALSVIVKDGYEGVSIEAIARIARITRPVVYDHFENLARLLQALIEREENYALEQLARVVPESPGAGTAPELVASGVRRFLDAVVSRPATWRVILLPPEGAPAIIREHVERNRALVLARIEAVLTQAGIGGQLDVELCARAIRGFSEEAGRMVLTDPDHYPAERVERFALAVTRIMSSP
jgi:AcrR family transcriptional regulator